jgi:hypothetical protein
MWACMCVSGRLMLSACAQSQGQTSTAGPAWAAIHHRAPLPHPAPAARTIPRVVMGRGLGIFNTRLRLPELTRGMGGADAVKPGRITQA